MNKITIYTKDNCQQCEATKKKFHSLGVPYNEINLDEDAEAVDFVKKLGYSQAPVVFVSWWDDATDGVIEQHWSGFRPDRIKKAVS